MSTQVANTARVAVNAAKQLGGTVPPKVAKAIADASGKAEDLRRWGRDLADHEPLGNLVLDCLARGDDPRTDPAVARALVADQLAQRSGTISEAADDRVTAVVTEHLDALVHAFDKPFDAAATSLAAAADVLDRHGLTWHSEAASVLAAPPAATTAHSELRTAAATIQRIRNTLAPLLVAATSGHIVSSGLWWIDPQGHTAYDLEPVLRDGHPAAVLAADMRLSLAGPAEAWQRAEAMELARYEAEEQAEERRMQAVRNALGAGVAVTR